MREEGQAASLDPGNLAAQPGSRYGILASGCLRRKQTTQRGPANRSAPAYPAQAGVAAAVDNKVQ